MLLRFLFCAGIVLLLPAAASDDHAEERARLNGAWQSENESKEAIVWLVEGAPAKPHLTQSQNGEKVLEMECDFAQGGGCEGKDTGQPVKVFMWFNGPKLVQLETRGTELIRRHFQASEDGTTLELETVLPEGKPEMLRLKRMATSAVRTSEQPRSRF